MTSSESSLSQETSSRLIDIHLDQTSMGSVNPAIEHEREVAIFDLLERNTFKLAGHESGPYKLALSLAEDRLLFAVSPADQEGAAVMHTLPLTPFKSILKDYFLVCDSYYQAIRNAPPSRIQAIDTNRRALHDEGTQILVDRLAGKIAMDFDTARRLFTLLCALHWKG